MRMSDKHLTDLIITIFYYDISKPIIHMTITPFIMMPQASADNNSDFIFYCNIYHNDNSYYDYGFYHAVILIRN